jgi:hypothetical protein
MPNLTPTASFQTRNLGDEVLPLAFDPTDFDSSRPTSEHPRRPRSFSRHLEARQNVHDPSKAMETINPRQ